MKKKKMIMRPCADTCADFSLQIEKSIEIYYTHFYFRLISVQPFSSRNKRAKFKSVRKLQQFVFASSIIYAFCSENFISTENQLRPWPQRTYGVKRRVE